MTENIASSVPNLNALGLPLPSPEEGLFEGKRRLAQTFGRSELVWIVGETYDPVTPAWNIDIVRQGATGAWVRQRTRFDEQAEVLYYLGETPLSAEQFRAARRQGQVFPIADWQDR